jgi:hypothetical protein
MELCDEFFFAHATPIYRVVASIQNFQALNEAHPNFHFGSFLGWRLRLGSGGCPLI